MTIATIKTDEKIMRVWRRAIKRALPHAKIEVMESEPQDVLQLLKELEAMNDDVLYTLPVHVIHSGDFLQQLEERDFIAFKETGKPNMTTNFFAVTNAGLKKIIEFGNSRYEYDSKIDVDMNLSNLVLNALGERVEFKVDNNAFIHTLDETCKGRGMIATMCGSAVIMQIVNSAKLNMYDIIPQLMETKAQTERKVEYRDK